MVNKSVNLDKEICNGVVSIVFIKSLHGWTEPHTDARTEQQQRYYIPTATRCAGIIIAQNQYQQEFSVVKMSLDLQNLPVQLDVFALNDFEYRPLYEVFTLPTWCFCPLRCWLLPLVWWIYLYKWHCQLDILALYDVEFRPLYEVFTCTRDIVSLMFLPSMMLSIAPCMKYSACVSMSPQASASLSPSTQYCLQSANSCSTLASGSEVQIKYYTKIISVFRATTYLHSFMHYITRQLFWLFHILIWLDSFPLLSQRTRTVHH